MIELDRRSKGEFTAHRCRTIGPPPAALFDRRFHDRQEIRVQVSDNGPSMHKEALRFVFDPFALRSDSPLEYGIHLMACHFIVYHHGGRIEAKSEEGQGTTFTMHLPIHPNQVQSSEGEQELLQKVHLREAVWEKLISSY